MDIALVTTTASRPFWPRLMIGLTFAAVLAVTGAVLVKTFWRDGAAEVGQEKTADSQDTLGAKAEIEGRNPNAQSITFDHVFDHWTGSIVAVCGRVDIVEDQDSFEGFERFVFADGELTLEEADGSDVVAQKWDDLCD